MALVSRSAEIATGNFMAGLQGSLSATERIAAERPMNLA
jgi:hypothetical protein